MTAPLIVVETPAYGDLVERARAVGWVVANGWDASPRGADPRRIVVTGRVDSLRDAAAAVRRAMSGSGVIAHGTGAADVLDMLCDDLRRFGQVRHIVEGRGEPTLDTEGTAVIELVATGATVDDVAARLHLSRRTVHRRLAAVREAYGAGTTAAAVAAHRTRTAQSNLAPPDTGARNRG